LLQYLLVVNLVLLLFNLVPAFPMDGGRILRAALTITTNPFRATEIAARIGQATALLFAVGGLLLGNPFLIVIALFVFIGASQEARTFRQRAALDGKTARDAMMTRFESLAPQDSLEQVARRLVATHQHDFPVVDTWDRVVGVLSRPRLLRQLSEQGGQTLVLDAMDREVPIVTPGDDLQRVLGLLRSGSHSPVLVMQERQLLGMITLEKLVEFIELSRREATETKRA
jgi:stage IV sporulation protein FB